MENTSDCRVADLVKAAKEVPKEKREFLLGFMQGLIVSGKGERND